jgi:hypothetical protein
VTTNADRQRFRALQDLGCICCLLECVGYQMPQIHHLVDKGYRRLSGGHQATIPLCPWHHVGMPPPGMNEAIALNTLGPSLALNKKLFNRTYGGERKLLEQVDAQLNMRKTA